MTGLGFAGTRWPDWRRAVGWLLFGCALAVLFYRWMNFDLLPFILDEPVFLRVAREQLRTGVWAKTSPVMGNQGLFYGPGVIWLYGAVHLVAGPRPETHMFVDACLVMLATVAVAVAVGRAFGDSLVLPATLLVWIASSPYQFFWSRIAWDQLTEVCAGGAIALLSARRRLSWGRSALLGLLLGVGLSTHLMFVPLAMIALAVGALRGRPGRRIAQTCVLGGSALLVTIPYLSYLAAHPPRPSPARHWADVAWVSIKSFLAQPARVGTLAGFEYFFDGDWGLFLKARSHWRNAAELCNKLVQSDKVLWLTAFVLVMVVLTTASAERRRMAALTLPVWVGYALFYPWRGLGPQPNYQWPTWWIVPVAIASGIYLVRRWLKPLWPLGIAAVWVVALAQTWFLLDWMGFIRDRGGTRGVHYGTVLSEQRRAIGEACRRAPAHVMLEAQTTIFETSVRYLFDIEPACAGKSLYFARSVWIAEQPPPSGQPVTKVRFSYERADSARLRVEVVP